MTFHEIILAIHNYEYPHKAAFVSIWWDNFPESEKIMRLLRELGYKVNYYREKGATEIRFSYTYKAKKHPAKNSGDY
jgi:hypothetical protein